MICNLSLSIIFTTCVLSSAVAEGPADEERRIASYVTGGGNKLALPHGLPRLIARVAAYAKANPSANSIGALAAILQDEPASDAEKASGRSALYEFLSTPDQFNRMTAVSLIARMDKASATNSLLPMLNDQAIQVRIEVARMLGFFAPPETAVQVRNSVDARKAKLTPAEIAADPSFTFAEVAIKRLQRRQIDPNYDAETDDSYNGSNAAGDTP